MPRRSLFTATEREKLIAFPDSEDELYRRYMFSTPDLSIILKHRGAANRLGFGVLLCCLRFPGISLVGNQEPPAALLALVAKQLAIPVEYWNIYGQRKQTRQKHQMELQAWLKLTPFGAAQYRYIVWATFPT